MYGATLILETPDSGPVRRLPVEIEDGRDKCGRDWTRPGLLRRVRV